MGIELHRGDCLEVMAKLPAASVDAVITDPPYGTTDCKWDVIIPLEEMWTAIKRVAKPQAVVCLFAAQPFTSRLVMSNLQRFRYSLIWDKVHPVGFLNAPKMPLRVHEDILLFGNGQGGAVYNPQMVKMDEPRKEKARIRKGQGIYGFKCLDAPGKIYTHKHPQSIITQCSNAKKRGKVHPTEKPTELMEYLVLTYSNEGDTVLDFTMGSGSTGVACKNMKRGFVGIERDEDYFAIAERRLAETPFPLV